MQEEKQPFDAGYRQGEGKAREERREFLLNFSMGVVSLLELESLCELGLFEFNIVEANEKGAVIECTRSSAVRLILRLGGCFKIAEVVGRELSAALEALTLPFEDKFNWTVSAYGTQEELFLRARQELHDLLKQKRLGRSKFLTPEEARLGGPRSFAYSELKASEVQSRILFPENGIEGIDFVVHSGLKGNAPIFAQTIATSDLEGYEKRDFKRPFQDPTLTLSPRMARVLVNLVSRSRRFTILDPFCGLGTILQEGLICGQSVIGVDRVSGIVSKAKENLAWVKQEYRIGREQRATIFAYDARRISRARMPAIDAVATEPILIPVFKNNPSASLARSTLEKAKETYERCITEFAEVLHGSGSRMALTTPVLFDSSGRSMSLSLDESAARAGLRPYRGRFAGRMAEYPLRIDSSKKRIVQRAVNVFCLP